MASVFRSILGEQRGGHGWRARWDAAPTGLSLSWRRELGGLGCCIAFPAAAQRLSSPRHGGTISGVLFPTTSGPPRSLTMMMIAISTNVGEYLHRTENRAL